MFGRLTSIAALRWAFWSCAVVVLVLALIPPSRYMPSTPWDKLNHALAFAVLAVLAIWSYRTRVAVMLTGLLVYGGLIELLQGLTPYRSAEWGDWLADAVGLALGWQLARMTARARRPAESAE
jgi:VanZ family protein